MPKGMIQDYTVKAILQEVSTGAGSTDPGGRSDNIEILDPAPRRRRRRRRRKRPITKKPPTG